MSTAAELKAKMQTANPDSDGRKTPAERRRIPMTSPQRKLELPEIPGYHTQWIRGTQERIAQAIRAGFEFIDAEEAQLNTFDLAGEPLAGGSTDMGSRVSVVEGGEIGLDGQAVRMYAMKQRKEYYDEDQKLVQDRNDAIVDALVANIGKGTVGGRAPGETDEDAEARFVDRSRTKIPELFRRKR